MLGVMRGLIFINSSGGVVTLNPMAIFGQQFGMYLDDETKTLWSWGYNSRGQLGDNTISSVSSPISVVGNISWKYITSGNTFAAGIKTDGTCWAWGDNASGQLGINISSINTSKSSPISVLGGNSFVEICSGNTCMFGLKSDGTLWAWGYNWDGRLGSGDLEHRSSPVSVVGGHSFVSIATGGNFNAALKADGSVWTWGVNTYGQLGDETTEGKSSPVSVVGEHSFYKVCCGYNFVLALKDDGSAWAWGDNSSGQLGTGDTINYSSPVSIVTNVFFTDIATGQASSYGISNDGSVWAWGDNSSGQLGTGDNTLYSSPVSVIGNHSFKTIFSSQGVLYAGGLKHDGTAWMWGDNTFGQLGTGTSNDLYSSPTSVLGDHSFTFISVGASGFAGMGGYTISLKSDGSVWAWGANFYGQFGNSTRTNTSSPVSVSNGLVFSKISAGSATTGGILSSDGSAWSWGSNSYGQLGNNDSEYGSSRSSPVSVVGDHIFTKISGGQNHMLGLKSDGSVWAWGGNSAGQLGTNNIIDRSSPVSIAGDHSFVDISASTGFSAAIRGDGTAWTWGTGSNGQLGNNSIGSASSPISVVGDHTFTKIVCGGTHILGLKSNGEVWSWGSGAPVPTMIFGQLGDGTRQGRSSPVSVVGNKTFKDIAAGAYQSYGLDIDGHCWAWGRNQYGELGINLGNTSRSSPVSVVGDHVFTSIFSDSGAQMAGGIKADGSIWVWGNNMYGQLGDGTRINRSSPVSVPGLPLTKSWKLTTGFEVDILPEVNIEYGVEAFVQGNNVCVVTRAAEENIPYMKLYDSSGTLYAVSSGYTYVGGSVPSLNYNTIKNTDWVRWNGEVNVVLYSKWSTTDATAIIEWQYDYNKWSWALYPPISGTQLNNGNFAFITVGRTGEGADATSLNICIFDKDFNVVLDQTLLTTYIYPSYFNWWNDTKTCETDDGGFATLYRINNGESISYKLYIFDSSGTILHTIDDMAPDQVDERDIFNVGGRLWVCFWNSTVNPDSGTIYVYEYDGTLTKTISIENGFIGNNGYIGKPGYFTTTPKAVVLFGSGGKYKLYNNSDLSIYSTGTLKVASQTPVYPGKCLTRQDGSVVWVASMPAANYYNWYLVSLTTEYKY